MFLKTTYDELVELLETVPRENQMDSWKEKFNFLASELEYREEDDDEIPVTSVVPEWQSKIMYINEQKRLFILSPPLVNGTVTVRLGVDVVKPVMNRHITSFVFDVDDKFNAIPVTARTVCLVTNDVGASLTAIFALWDQVARVGIKESLEIGFINDSWIDNVFQKTLMICGKNKMFDYKTDLNIVRDIDTKLYRLELLCRSKGIDENDLRGDMYIINPSSHRSIQLKTSSWIKDSTCKACKKHVDDVDIEHHVKTNKHRVNAAAYLLKKN